MSNITVAANCSVDNLQQVIVGSLPAASALTAGMPVTISGSAIYPADADNKWYTNKTSYVGFVVDDVALGCGASIYGKGTVLRDYSTGLTSGTPLYVSNAVGQLSDVIVASADEPVAVAINDTDILVIK